MNKKNRQTKHKVKKNDGDEYLIPFDAKLLFACTVSAFALNII